MMARSLVTAAACTFVFTAALALSTVLAQSPSLEQALGKILAPLEETQAKGKAVLGERSKQYLADLAALEQTLAARTGSLDAVIHVRAERDAWSEGQVTVAPDPKDDQVPLELRKLRYYYDRDVIDLKQKSERANAGARVAAVTALEGLEARLTKAAQVDDALAVRRELTKLRAIDPTRSSLKGLHPDTLAAAAFGQAVENSFGMVFLAVEPGEFEMGSPEDEPGRMAGPWETQHRVVLTHPFWLAKTELTRAQWAAVMGSPASGALNKQPPGDNLPLRNLHQGSIRPFLKQLNEKERRAGFLPEGWVYTLPTEAQWQYACRAGSTAAAYGPWDEIAWNFDDVHPVGTKKPNAWGFHDLLGNVWEPTRDYYSVLPSEPQINPQGPRFTLPSATPEIDPAFTIVGLGKGAARRAVLPCLTQRAELGLRVALVPEASVAPDFEAFVQSVFDNARRKRWAIARGVAVRARESLAANQLASASADAALLTELITLAETRASVRPQYPAATVEFGGHRYLPVPFALTWQQADEFAALVGGHLVAVTSDGEQAWLQESFADELGWSWIGAHDRKKTGQWAWTTGESWSFAAWKKGEPNAPYAGTAAGHAACMDLATGTWSDVALTPAGVGHLGNIFETRFPFVIEWEND